MIYTKKKSKNMCIVNRDANHGPAPHLLKRENGCRRKKSKIFRSDPRSWLVRTSAGRM